MSARDTVSVRTQCKGISLNTAVIRAIINCGIWSDFHEKEAPVVKLDLCTHSDLATKKTQDSVTHVEYCTASSIAKSNLEVLYSISKQS